MERVALIVFGLAFLCVGGYAIGRRPPYQTVVQLLGWLTVGGAAAVIGIGISG